MEISHEITGDGSLLECEENSILECVNNMALYSTFKLTFYEGPSIWSTFT